MGAPLRDAVKPYCRFGRNSPQSRAISSVEENPASSMNGSERAA